MAPNLSSLLTEQRIQIEQLKRVLINFKKLPKANLTLPKTEGRLANLEKLWEKCESLHVRISQTATQEEIETSSYFRTDEFLTAEDAYLDAADHIQDVLGKLRGNNVLPTRRGNDSSIHGSDGGTIMQLPRIGLPKFSGKSTEWESFRGMYESLVAQSDVLTNVQKLHYLKNSLEGEAALLISTIKVSDTNYAIAWDRLVAEYENQSAIIYANIHAFFDLPIMKSESVTELKRLRDQVSSSLVALSNLERPVEHWDDLLVYVISQKFSPRTRNEWSLLRGKSDRYPTYKEIHDFMTERIRGLSEYPRSGDTGAKDTRSSKARSSVHFISSVKCVSCAGNHGLAKCEEFLRQSVENRRQIVQKANCCFNCLKPDHFSKNCKTKPGCNRCRRPHHSSLHQERFQASQVNSKGQATTTSPLVDKDLNIQSSNTELGSSASVQSVFAQREQRKVPSQVLLATAWVSLRTAEGRVFNLRALLDQGSTYSFISESLCQTMRTKRRRANLRIHCFGETFGGVAKSCVDLVLAATTGCGPSFPFTGYVHQRITAYAASRERPTEVWPHLRDLPLADPNYSNKQPIHVLIGADLYGSLLLNDLRQGPLGTPTAQLTIFGWVLSGPLGKSFSDGETVLTLHCTACDDTNSLLKRFWEDEGLPSAPPPHTEDEEMCERHFVETHTRDSQGRYVVRLPFKSGPPLAIGETFKRASLLYAKLETRLKSKPSISSLYRDFLEEYESLGHMERVPPESCPRHYPVYIPHHGVFRESSSTTKLRVVFNGSYKTSNGTSLNDHLMIGPKLQQDIAAIITRWRQHRFVYTADIAKMFRQISVHRDDVDFQRILWRPSDEFPVQSYRLLTVTYGLAPAPFLAMRVLKQLARDEGKAFPKALPICEHSIYVDDVLFGANDVVTLREIRRQLVGMLECGGFPLRKWTANSLELLSDIPERQREMSDRLINQGDTLKVLGLSWSPREDAFQFLITPPSPATPTKRSVLSTISRLYDPLGWASPVVVTAKILMQELWLRRVEWDALLPSDLTAQWQNYSSDLLHLEKIRIPRWTGMQDGHLSVELHGFADASSRAYAAVIYIRVLHPSQNVQVSLVAAKTKVAPLQTISIPRLELNAVVLLSRLVAWIQNSLKLEKVPLFGWTDSMIAIAWLRQHPSKWKVYVANRVSEVQQRHPAMRWLHVKSKDNPADCASRGIPASDLADHQLWWHGPLWLQEHPASWPCYEEVEPPIKDFSEVLLSETRHQGVHQIASIQEWSLPEEFSSWTRLLRVTAFLRRFIQNLKNKLEKRLLITGALTAQEIKDSTVFWLRSVQSSHFSTELSTLEKGDSVSKKSPLRLLHPIIGKENLIRLGGRLVHSALCYDERHPVVLPRCRVSELLIDWAHRRCLHGGTQLTLRLLRQSYWIISARSLVKSHIHKCVKCVRHSAQTATQLMGDLPSPRVTPSPPFTHTGVDYAGPMDIIKGVSRGQRTTKHYVAVFVCLSTRAIHLESVDDYTTNGFLAAFDRFVARRGLPSDMYSDNGTNFHGADRELSRSFKAVLSDQRFHDSLACDVVTWHFIPPVAPHFGGLWEAGVKSLKYHLRRVIGSHVLSKEEFSTLLCKVEGCLNSRPVAALTDDPSDLSALTPGHFLIGRPLVSVPQQSVLEVNSSRLSRWQRVQAMQEQIWRSWVADYLHSLQTRQKWPASNTDIKIGELVLLKNNLLPPSKWELARITQVHPGMDNRVRVVTLRTAKSAFKRPITQICRLPSSILEGSTGAM